jgi:hypothetical protein
VPSQCFSNPKKTTISVVDEILQIFIFITETFYLNIKNVLYKSIKVKNIFEEICVGI